MPISHSASAIPLIDLDMPSNALCSVPSFDADNPVDGAITCRATHAFTYASVEDGDK